MNKTLLFIQADMHRAINDGRRSLEISVLDLKELIAAVASAEGREQAEKLGYIFGFIRKETLNDMRSGKSLYCSIRRKKNLEYTDPVFCDPKERVPIDVVAETEETA